MAAVRVDRYGFQLRFRIRSHAGYLGKKVQVTKVFNQRQHRGVSQCRRIPHKWKPLRKTSRPWMKGRKRISEAANVRAGTRIEDVEVECDHRASVENRGHAANHDEFHTAIAERPDRAIDFHYRRLEAMPRSGPRLSDVCCSLTKRSAGDSRSCSINSVKSIPNFFAASIRLPGAGFRKRAAARSNSSGVSARNSFITSVYSFLTYSVTNSHPPRLSSGRNANARRDRAIRPLPDPSIRREHPNAGSFQERTPGRQEASVLLRGLPGRTRLRCRARRKFAGSPHHPGPQPHVQGQLGQTAGPQDNPGCRAQ